MTLNTEFYTLWLSPVNFQSAGSILTNDTSEEKGGPCAINVMGLRFDPMPLGSSIEGKQKGLFAAI